MTTEPPRPNPRSWFEFEYLLPPSYGRPGWRRSKFTYYSKVFGITAEPTEEAMAFEMLVIQSKRYRPGTRVRLVRVTEAIGAEIASPDTESRG